MLKKILVIFVMPWFVYGCATINQVPTITNLNTSVSISNDSLNQETGILVGSYTKNVGEPEYGVRALKFTDTNTYDSRYAIDRKTLSSILGHEYTLKSDDKVGDAFAIELPAGEYTFYNFSLAKDNYNSTESWRSSGPFSVPFTIEPNKVNYIGEINFNAITRKRQGVSAIGRPYERRGGYWIFSDQLVRDKPEIEMKFKNLSLANVVNVIPKTKKRFTPFIILPSEEEKFQAELKAAKEKTEGDEVFGKPINTIWMTCNKPYKLSQDCSTWTAANRKIVIDGNKVNVAGSEQGDIVFVMVKPHLWTGEKKESYNFIDLITEDRLIHSSYYSIKKIINDANINIKEVRILKEFSGITGYGMTLDGDGYSLLKELTIEKKDKK